MVFLLGINLPNVILGGNTVADVVRGFHGGEHGVVHIIIPVHTVTAYQIEVAQAIHPLTNHRELLIATEIGRVCLLNADMLVPFGIGVFATSVGDGEYIFGGQHTTVKDGKSYLDNGTINGSTTNLFDCIRCAISFGVPEADAVKMATENPARLMNLNKGIVEKGYDADLIFVDDDFNLKAVMLAGIMQ